MSQPAGVLTYHRLTDQSTAFYDVDWATFERHVRLIARRATSVEGPWVRLAGERTVAISFDDGTADHVRAAEILAHHGLPGTFFIVSGWMDTEGFVTSTDVASMAEAGHVIGSHSAHHRLLPTLSDEELTAELTASRTALEQVIGRRVNWLAPPGGACDDRVLAAAGMAGYDVVRTMEWGYTTDTPSGRTSCLPVFRNYDDAMVTRLIDGRAPLWRYRAKTTVKRLLPDKTYHRLRAISAAGRR